MLSDAVLWICELSKYCKAMKVSVLSQAIYIELLQTRLIWDHCEIIKGNVLLLVVIMDWIF